MNKAILAGMVVLSMSGFAYAQAEHPQQTARPTNAVSDSDWATNVARDGLAEVELGKLATEKASSDQVKQFAKRMVDDHSKANDELKEIASRKNITLPSDLDPKHKALRDRLMKLSGEAFDRAYITAMVDDHRRAVAAFKLESRNGKDPDLKAFAAKTLPILEEHLKMAQEASRAVVGTSGSKGGYPKGTAGKK